VLRAVLLRKASSKISDESIEEFMKKFKKEKEEQKHPSVVQKELQKNELELLKSIGKADQALANVDFKVNFLLKRINFAFTGDKDDLLLGNATLLEFGLEDQTIKLAKEGFICKASVFGFTFKTLNSFEMIVMFLQKLKKFSKMHSDNIAIQSSFEHYKRFI